MTSEKFSLRTIVLALAAITAFTVGAASSASFAQDAPADAPAAEAMMEVEGLEARLCAASGLSAAHIMWSITTVVVEELLKRGKMPGVLRSANFPGGNDYNKSFVEPRYEKEGL